MGPGAHARRVAGGGLVSAATGLVLLGGSILPFLSPALVRFEQDRSGAAALTGYSAAELDEVTGWLLGHLVLWQGDFDRTLNGSPVLKQPEIDHMRDVRNVFAGFFALAALAGLVLVAAFARRGTEVRFATWRAVRNGAAGLAVAIAVAGVLVIVAFEAVFELFHQLFFTRGSYTFDPATDKLVQLFPMQFWSETALVVGGVALVACLVTWTVARSRARST